MILIIYENEDLSTISFIDFCKNKGYAYYAIRTEDMVNDNFSIIDNKKVCIWKIGDNVVNFDFIRGIYLRNTTFVDNNFKNFKKEDRFYVKKEWWSYLVYSMSKSKNCINSITLDTISSSITELPFFLNLAHENGLNIPYYIFSRSFKELEEIFYKGDKKYIALRSLIPNIDFRVSNTISNNDIGIIEYIKGKPIFVHIVGDNIFACRYEDKKSAIELDHDTKRRCLLICKKLNIKVAQMIFIEETITRKIYFMHLSLTPNWNLNHIDNTAKIFIHLYNLLIQPSWGLVEEHPKVSFYF